MHTTMSGVYDASPFLEGKPSDLHTPEGRCNAANSNLRASAIELVLLRMLSSDIALSLDEALLRLRVLAAGPDSPVAVSARSLHKATTCERRTNSGSSKISVSASSLGCFCWHDELDKALHTFHKSRDNLCLE